MNKQEIYINEQQLELRKDTVIAITIQIYNLSELKDHQVNYTNRVKVPKTATNKNILGFAEQIESSARMPYKLHNARVIIGGYEEIPDGVAIISEIANDYEIVIYSGLFDLFENLNGLDLHDLPLLPELDHDYTVAVAAASVFSTTTNSITLKGLRDGVTYDYRIQTVCSSSASSWTTADTFTTGGSSSTPGAVSVSEIDTTTARVDWGSVTGATDYEYRIKESGGSYGSATSTSGDTFVNLSGLSSSTVHYVQVRSVISGSEGAWSSEKSFDTTASTLDAAWTVTDIGTIGDAGYGNEFASNTKIVGSGTQINSTADSFCYVHQSITGDATIIVRLHDFNGYNSSSVGGIMVRDSLNANSKHASMLFENDGTVSFKRRSTTGGQNVSTTYASSGEPLYLKLEVVSNKVEGFYSSDGVSWTQLGPDPSITSGTSYIGICVCNYDNSPGTSSSVQVDTLSIDGASGGGSCGLATNLGVSGVTKSTANLTWTAGSGAEGYNVQFRESGQSDWILYTNPYIYPAVQYGTLDPADNDLDIRYSYPAIYVSHLIADMIDAQGYTLKGSFLNDPFYYQLALPFSKRKYEHSDRYVNERSFENQLGQTLNVFDFATATASNDVGALIPLEPNQVYTASGNTTLDATIKVTVTDYSENKGASDTITVKLCIYKNSSTILNSTTINTNGSFSVSQASISLIEGDTLQAAIIADFTIAGSNTISYSLKLTSASMYSDPIDRAIAVSEEVTAEAILPKLNQKRLLKSISNLFGLIYRVDNRAKTIEFKRLSDIKKNIYKALDWSSKLVKPKSDDPDQWYVSKETVLSDNYGQKSYLRYKSDDTVNDEVYDGYLTVDNEVLELQKDLFVLPFAASDSDVTMSHDYYLAEIDFWESDGGSGWQEVNDKPEQRLIYIDRLNSDINYTDGTTTVIKSYNCPFGKFKDPTSALNLDFVSLKAKYYSEFQEVLTDAVKLTVLLYLDAKDILDFDYFVPVYIDRFGEYFYVNKISNYVEGKVSTVELIKIS